MTDPVAQFVKRLEESGILEGDTLQDFIPPKAVPKNAEDLARELVRNKKLTKFQAEEIFRGKGRGLVLGKYLVLDKIGAGGMGQVFKAEHRHMKRIVAVKVLPAQMMKNPAHVARFEREVMAAARLNHPNIVAAFDASNAGGVHLLVMEYVEGNDLSAVVKKKGPLPVGLAVNYVLQAARGLEAAHAEGIVHRDIKPANLLLDKTGVVKILDMGLARLGGETPGQAELTHTGTIMGTVDYMAPEQAVNTKTADARADVYSLGCSLYYLLTGKAAYDGETLMAKLLAHRDQPIPSLRSTRPEIPEPVEAVFSRMVAKRIDDRYQTMSEVISDLERLLNGQEPSIPATALLTSTSDEGLSEFLKDVALAPAAPVRPRKSLSPANWIPVNLTGLLQHKKPLLIAAGGVATLVLIVSLTVGLRTKDSAVDLQANEPAADAVVADKSEPMAGSQKADNQKADNQKSIAKVDLPFEGKPSSVQVPAIAPSNAPLSGPPTQGRNSIALFNGRDLSGWTIKGDRANWEIDAAKGVLTANGKGWGWLLTDREFEDFRLSLEFQAEPKSNSGIGVLAAPDDADFLELQIGRTPEYPTGGMWSLPTNTTQGGFLRPTQPAGLKPDSEWNSLELEIADRVMTCRVNGAEVSQFDLEKMWRQPGAFPALKRSKGRIALQSRAAVVRFRKISISEINGPVSTWVASDPEHQKWMAEVGALPADKQVAAVEQKLRQLNPRFQGKVAHRIEAGVVTDLQFITDRVTTIAPVRALAGLQRLHCYATLGKKSKLADLAPLAGLRLRALICYGTEIADLTPLRGMPLVRLDIGNTRVSDLTPLKGMRLHELKLGWTAVTDLSPIAGMPLTTFWCWGTDISDLSVLRGMPLQSVCIHDTPVSDLSPLFGMNIEELVLTPGRISTGIDEIRQMKSMVRIGHQRNNQPLPTPDDFWKRYDAGEFGKTKRSD